jgi:hypothetical protein
MTAEFKVRNGLIINATTAVSSILDEDTMSSDSATALATQQSIKAYVDIAGNKFYDLGIYGFTNSTSTSISFNDSTYTFTLTDTGSGWSYYRNGVKNTITGNKTVVFSGSPPTANTYYVFIDDNIGTLSYSTTPWTLNSSKVFVAVVIWNNTNTPKYQLADERHKSLWPRYIHRYLHQTRGTALVSGGVPGDYATPAGSPSSDDDNTFSITETQIADEDIDHTLAALTDPSGSGTDYTLFYRTGASTWTWESSGVPFKYTTDGYLQYDSSGTMTQGSSSNYYNWYLLYTNISGAARYIIVPGRGEFTSASAAYGEAYSTFDWSGFPIQECIIAYQLTFYANTAYTVKGKCKLARAPQRIITSFAAISLSGNTTDHNTLSGLQGGAANDYYHLTNSQHTIATQAASTTLSGYLTSTDWNTFNSKENALTFSTGLTRATNTITSDISTGKSGGQSIYGGTAAGDDLTIYSTSNATKGNIFFGTSTYDEVNNRLGIGTVSPVSQLEVYSTGATEVSIKGVGNSASSDIQFYRAKSGPAAVISEDSLGSLIWNGYGASTYVSGASINARAEGTFTNSSSPAYLAFRTTPSGSTTTLERMRITSAGNMWIGTTSGINVNGTTYAYPLIVASADSSPQFNGIVVEGSASSCRLVGARHNGTLASKTAVASGDVITAWTGLGWDGGVSTPTYVDAIQIRYEVDGAVSEDIVPARMIFMTRNTSGAYAERMRLTSAGLLGIANNSPSALLTLGTAGTTAGSLSLAGATSGTITVNVAAAAGTWSLTLPTTDGDSGQFLQTNGSGITTWASATTGAAGSTGYVQFNSSNILSADSAFFWDNTNKRLGLSNTSPGTLLTLGTAGTTAGVLSLAGATSGTCTVQVAAVAGTTTFQLPPNNGTNTYFLQTNGSGITSWAAGAIPAGSTGYVQYNSSGSLAATDNFRWDNSNRILWVDAESGNSLIASSCEGDSSSSYFPRLAMYRHRGTRATPAVLVNSTVIGRLSWMGNYDGASASTSTAWAFVSTASGTWSSGSTPSYLQLLGASTSSADYQVMRFEGTNVGIGSHTTLTERLDLQDGSGNGAIRIGNTGNSNAGTIKYTSNTFSGYNGSTWVNFGSGSPGGSTGHVQYNTGSAFGGEASLFWDATNDRLGIGTSSPVSPLDIVWQSDSSGICYKRQYSTSAYPIQVMIKSRGTTGSPTTAQSGDILGGYLIGGQYNTGATNYDKSCGMYGTASETHSSTARGTYMSFWTTPNTTTTITERLRITDAGNVWIGTTAGLSISATTNTYSFEVLGADSGTQQNGIISEGTATPGRFNGFRHNNTYASKTAVADTNVLQGFNAYGWDGGTTPTYVQAAAINLVVDGTVSEDCVPGSILFWTRAVGNTSGALERMRITNAGNVYIGTTAGLNIAGTALTHPLIVHSADSSPQQNGIVVQGSASSCRFYGARHNGTLASKTAVASGDVLATMVATGWDAGTTATYVLSSQIKFEVDGSVSEDNVPGRMVFLTCNTSGSFAERLRLGSDGKLTSSAMYSGYTIGGTNKDLYIDSNGLIGVLSSSLRTKQNVSDMESISWIDSLRPVNFEYKNTPGIKQYGLIAEEVNDVNSALVGFDEEGLPDSVNYDRLVPVLLKAVQELRAEITILKGGN